MPRVSVVMPVYGAERFVGEAVESVLAQDFGDLELIVVDDGSTDRSAEVCASFRDPRLRVLPQANAGVAAARNAGIRAARGEIIALLDADDAWLPAKLARHVALLERYDEVGATFSHSSFIDEDGRPLGSVRGPTAIAVTPLGILLRDPIGNGSNLVARRSVFDAIARRAATGEPAFFDEDRRLATSEDTECWFRLSYVGHTRFACVDEPLTRYRLHSRAGSADLRRKADSWEVLVGKVAHIAPELVERHGDQIRAYQLAAIARRALSNRDVPSAGAFLWAACRLHPRLLLEEPAATLLTVAGWTALALLPAGTHDAVLALGARLHRARQRTAIRRAAPEIQ